MIGSNQLMRTSNEKITKMIGTDIKLRKNIEISDFVLTYLLKLDISGRLFA